jgi:hypothetical protein
MLYLSSGPACGATDYFLIAVAQVFSMSATTLAGIGT